MNDSLIVDLYWSRSEKAIEETDKAYGRYFHYIAYGILKSEEDSREIVNDTYLKAWNNIPPERPYNLKAFLGRMTRQLSINRLEQNLAKKRGEGQYSLVLDELSQCLSSENEGADIAQMAALTSALNTFLRSLPEEKRSVFIRRYWHMSSISEIANDFSMSESKVKSMLLRTRGELKKYLLREGFDL